MSKKLIILLLAATLVLSAAAAAGAQRPDAVRVIVAPRTGDQQPPAPLGVAPALPPATGPVIFNADFMSAATVHVEHVTAMGGTQTLADVAASTWGGSTINQWFLAGIRVSGTTLTVLVDGRPVLTTQVAAGAGRVGVYSTALGYAG